MDEQTRKEVEVLRAFVREKANLTPEEQEEAEAWLEQAGRGDAIALVQARTLAAKGGYQPPPGEGPPLPPGPLLVCPEDPEHYAEYAAEEGVELFCPEHGVKLVPKAAEKG